MFVITERHLCVTLFYCTFHICYRYMLKQIPLDVKLKLHTKWVKLSVLPGWNSCSSWSKNISMVSAPQPRWVEYPALHDKSNNRISRCKVSFEFPTLTGSGLFLYSQRKKNNDKKTVSSKHPSVYILVRMVELKKTREWTFFHISVTESSQWKAS